ncbi:hybrid sensor histidine kinase/response regulator, partial [Pseudomonas aeruginosa]|nr:hybrid sensor histidine kinase/response regulator [Pseudomonas aeruginosa]
ESCPDAPEALRPTHVLLVDDDRMVRYTTALLLGDLGYQVSEAALDLLVTDHLMADKTGVQLAEELRQRFPQLPVLVITGYANLRPE